MSGKLSLSELEVFWDFPIIFESDLLDRNCEQLLLTLILFCSLLSMVFFEISNSTHQRPSQVISDSAQDAPNFEEIQIMWAITSNCHFYEKLDIDTFSECIINWLISNINFCKQLKWPLFEIAFKKYKLKDFF